MDENFIEYMSIMKELSQLYSYDNPYCTHYLGIYIEKYVQRVLDAKPVPYTTIRYEQQGIESREKHVDWILEWDYRLKQSKQLKVKHLASCLVFDHGNLIWNFRIKFNTDVDAFVLTAFKDRESLEPLHIWFIKAKEKLKTKRTNREFWNRDSFKIPYNEFMIYDMKKYELINELRELKIIMETLKEKEDKEINIHRLLITKQVEIYDKTGEKRGIDEIIKQAIIAGIAKVKGT